MIHCGKILHKHGVIKGRRLSSIKFIIQVFAGIHQKDDDDDGRCTMFLSCMEFCNEIELINYSVLSAPLKAIY